MSHWLSQSNAAIHSLRSDLGQFYTHSFPYLLPDAQGNEISRADITATVRTRNTPTRMHSLSAVITRIYMRITMNVNMLRVHLTTT